MAASRKKKKRETFLILVIGALLAPACYSFLATIISEYRRQTETPEWSTYARIILVGLSIFFIVYAFFTEHNIRTKKVEKIRSKGKDPEEVILVFGNALVQYPGFIAFFIFLLGGTVADVYIFSAVSFTGVLAWSWRHRAIFKRPIYQKEATRPMVRAYTAVIIIMGVLYFFSGLLLVFVLLSRVYDFGILTALFIFLIFFYGFFAIGCWITAILRARRSPYALATTGAASVLFLPWIPFGTAAFVYWFGWVRKKEREREEHL